MKVSAILAAAALAAATLIGLSNTASAQATRTWVSGVGDDANPCSRTAPCKTFAGAIPKTATAGEINCLDPGGFGSVTITKSITIYCESVEAGVLVPGTSGIVINAPSTAVVVLRGLDIEGLGTGLNGVRFLAGAALHIDDCRIRNFSGTNGNGISFAPSTNAELLVTNSVIWNNSPAATGGGITIAPTAGATASVVIENTKITNNLNGIRVDDSASGPITLTVLNSVISHNTNNGIAANSVSSSITSLVQGTTSAYNAGIGIRSNGAGSVMRLSNSNITGNGTGLGPVAGGQIISFLNNRVGANTVNGAPTTTESLQ